MLWTAELIENVRKMRLDGKSYAIIAGELNTTKGVVIGKMSRLGIRRELAQSPTVIRKKQTLAVNVKTAKAPLILFSKQAPPNEPAPLKISLLNLGPFHCRSVIEETDDNCCRLYCGRPTTKNAHGKDSPYCAYHHARYRTLYVRHR